MTKLPKPSSWSAHYDLTYDAWNRLVAVSDTGTTVAGYEYDGRNYRTIKRTYTGGSLAETRHFYYNSGWQCLEERLEAGSVISSNANRQNVWGLRYTDDLVLRDRDADGSSGTGNLGTTGSGLEERLYAMQDPNWNVAAVADTSGAVQERYCYSAYGTPMFLTSAFATRNPNTSSYAGDALYTGRQYDPETGMYHYRNRPYGAELGRFSSRDPIGYEGGSNLYEYVGDSPLSWVDPSGKLWGWDCITCTACGGVSTGTCAALCSTGHWDCVNDTFGSCWGKCMKAALGDAPAFDAVCLAACGSCLGRQIGPKPPKKIHIEFPDPPPGGGGGGTTIKPTPPVKPIPPSVPQHPLGNAA